MGAKMSKRLCKSCDEPINPRRLAVIPHAIACVACINDGFVPDVFTYRSTLEQDSAGNIHVEIVQNEHEWEHIQRDKELERNNE